MRHSWLVLAVLLGVAGDAAAKRITCACPDKITLPQPGAQGLPLNAKLLRIVDGGTYLMQEELKLEPNLPYVDDALGISFTPGSVRDDVPPEPPRDVAVYIATSFDDAQAMSFFGGYAADTAVVHIVIEQNGETTTLFTTPSRLYLCQEGLRLTPGAAKVSISSIDSAGNQSAPFTTTVQLTPLDEGDAETDCRSSHMFSHRHHHGHGFEILFLLLLYPICLVAWVVIVIVRRMMAKRELAEPVALLAAEAVARRLMRWQIVWTVLLIGTALALRTQRDLNDLPIFIVPFIISTVGKLFLQHRALRLLDSPEVDAVRRGPWLVVTSLRDSVMVRASDADFVAAKRAALPKSVAK